LASFTPEQVKEANNARLQLRRDAKAHNSKKTYPLIKDERQVKRGRGPYTYFLTERFASGDMKGITIKEAGPLIAQEWKATTGAARKVGNSAPRLH